MKNHKEYDVIIVGGSYAGLSAALSLGRALLNVLVIDDGLPCNRQTPYSHNFLTNDGRSPAEITALATLQLSNYATVAFLNDTAKACTQAQGQFHLELQSGHVFETTTIIFATGIRDLLPPIKGFADCWGISVLHCPFCHGYEVRQQPTGILGNGDTAVELIQLIYNWSETLTLFTNGPATLTNPQRSLLAARGVNLIEKPIRELIHHNGNLSAIELQDGQQIDLPVLYAPVPFEQHCKLPLALGCALTPEGYLAVNPSYETTVKGCYAIGDNSSSMRTVANAVAAGNAAGIRISKELVVRRFR